MAKVPLIIDEFRMDKCRDAPLANAGQEHRRIPVAKTLQSALLYRNQPVEIAEPSLNYVWLSRFLLDLHIP